MLTVVLIDIAAPALGNVIVEDGGFVSGTVTVSGVLVRFTILHPE
jgi:hypothetical protein